MNKQEVEDESLLEDPLCSGERQPPEGSEDDGSAATATNNTNGVAAQVKKTKTSNAKQQAANKTAKAKGK